MQSGVFELSDLARRWNGLQALGDGILATAVPSDGAEPLVVPAHLSACAQYPNPNSLPPFEAYTRVRVLLAPPCPSQPCAHDLPQCKPKGKRSTAQRKASTPTHSGDPLEFDREALPHIFAPQVRGGCACYAFSAVAFLTLTAQPLATEREAMQLICNRAQYVISDLLLHLCGRYLTCAQLAVLIRALPTCVPGLRTQVACLMHSRVCDLTEWGRVMWALTLPERSEVVQRLGWLNVWDPMVCAPVTRYCMIVRF